MDMNYSNCVELESHKNDHHLTLSSDAVPFPADPKMCLDPDKMIETNAFISLPPEILCHVLGGWLELKEIVSVDSAFCNHKHRLVLMDTVYPLSVLQSEPSPLQANTAMTWMCKRRLRSSILVVFGNPLPPCCNQFLEISGKFIQRVKIRDVRGIDASEILRVLSTCYNMKSLMMECCQLVRSDETLWWKLRSWLHLESVSFDVRHELSVECEIAIDMIRATWQTIQRLELISHPEHALNRLKELFTFPKLVALSLCSTFFRDEELIAVLNKTPNLAHLNVAMCDQLSDTSGIYIAENLINLQTLDISWCNFTNTTLTALATHCAETLCTLSVSKCAHVDLYGLEKLLQKCKKLRALHTDSSVATGKWVQHLTSLTLDVRGDMFSLMDVKCLPYQCSLLEYVCLESRAISYAKLDFSAYTTENMPFLHTLNISSFPLPARGVCPTLDALRVERPMLKVTYDSFHNCCNVMQLPL